MIIAQISFSFDPIYYENMVFIGTPLFCLPIFSELASASNFPGFGIGQD